MGGAARVSRLVHAETILDLEGVSSGPMISQRTTLLAAFSP